MKNIRFIPCLALVALLAACQASPENSRTKIFVVTHAGRYPGFNGSLTWEGRIRAGDLMRTLMDSSIHRIYITPFARSEMMADSFRLQLHIDTAFYQWDSTGSDLIRQIGLHHDYGKSLLVIGHPQTVPAILRKLGATFPPSVLPDSLDDVLFEMVLDHGKVSLWQHAYGVRAP